MHVALISSYANARERERGREDQSSDHSDSHFRYFLVPRQNSDEACNLDIKLCGCRERERERE